MAAMLAMASGMTRYLGSDDGNGGRRTVALMQGCGSRSAWIRINLSC
jgi:hypothetical protein